VVADMNVAGILGRSRPLAIRESEVFFKLRNEVLHVVRREAEEER
jgi:NitT/TauT family transport system ATP-binding protein